MSLRIPNQQCIQKSYEKLLPASVPSKPSGPSTKGEIKDQQTTITPCKIIGIHHKTLPHKGRPSYQITTMHHKGNRAGTHRTMLCNTIHLMPPDGCKTQQSQWTLATPEPLIEDEEEEATLEEEEANMETANLPIGFKEMPLPLVTPLTHAFNRAIQSCHLFFCLSTLLSNQQ